MKTEELELVKNEKVFEINTISKRFSYFSVIQNALTIVIVTVTFKSQVSNLDSNDLT